MMAFVALQRPSLDASVPRLVPTDQLTATSALMSMSRNASVIAGSALGGVLAVTPGPWLVYVLDGACFAASFAFLGWLRPLPRPADSEHEPGPSCVPSRQESAMRSAGKISSAPTSPTSRR